MNRRSLLLALITLVALAALFAAACGDETAGSASNVPADVDSKLLDQVKADAKARGWVAGCAWQDSVAPADPLSTVKLAGLPNGAYSVATSQSPAGGYELSTVYRAGEGGAPATSFSRLQGAGYVCYVPS